MGSELEIRIKENDLILHPYGSVYWREQQALLIADLHFGKVDHFRRAGHAVPTAARDANYSRMDQLIHLYEPQHIYFLGDLFHSTRNHDWNRFAEWSLDQPNQTLIVGNHDRHFVRSLQPSNMKVVEKLVVNDFLLSHHPMDDARLFNICGHVHPSVVLRGRAGMKLKVSCFAQYRHQLILPAFGRFTGTHKIDPEACEHLYALTEEEVIRIR